MTLPPWPYPRWIAHRGAGKLAPENTLAAFRLGAHHGYRMFECDVKLSADDVPFLLHDDTLTRTTNAAAQLPRLGTGTSAVAGEQAWRTLSQLDAGSWHSPTFAGEPLATLDNLAAFCLANDYRVNLEIKPTPGTERHTGEVVAHQVARLWQAPAVPPLLTSFDVAALEGALHAQPALPRGLLLDTLWDGWLDTALALGCKAIICKYTLWDRASVAQTHNAGLRALSYTVNDAASAAELLEWGTDGFITDRVDYFSPLA